MYVIKCKCSNKIFVQTLFYHVVKLILSALIMNTTVHFSKASMNLDINNLSLDGGLELLQCVNAIKLDCPNVYESIT